MAQQSNGQPGLSKTRRVIYTIMPLTLLLLCLGLFNFVADAPPEDAAVVVIGGGTAVPANTDPAALVTLAPPTATAPATPSPTPTPLPTLPPDAAITLLGPPDGSVFSPTALLSLYWTWPDPLREDQYFVVYLTGSGGEKRLGDLTEPNLGDGYHWQIQPADLTGLGADFTWQIRLESTLAAAAQLTSEARIVRLIGNP